MHLVPASQRRTTWLSTFDPTVFWFSCPHPLTQKDTRDISTGVLALVDACRTAWDIAGEFHDNPQTNSALLAQSNRTNLSAQRLEARINGSIRLVTANNELTKAVSNW